MKLTTNISKKKFDLIKMLMKSNNTLEKELKKYKKEEAIIIKAAILKKYDYHNQYLILIFNVNKKEGKE